MYLNNTLYYNYVIIIYTKQGRTSVVVLLIKRFDVACSCLPASLHLLFIFFKRGQRVLNNIVYKAKGTNPHIIQKSLKCTA